MYPFEAAKIKKEPADCPGRRLVQAPRRLGAAFARFELFRFRRFWAVLLAPLAWGLAALADAYPHWTERLYSTGLYPVLQGSLGRLFALVPFSVCQWLSLVLLLAAGVYIIRQIWLIARRRTGRGNRFSRLIATLFCVAGTGYFLFILLCGLNYHRMSFAAASGLEPRPSSTAELAALCDDLILQANSLRAALEEDADGGVQSAFASNYEKARYAQEAFGEVGREYPVLRGFSARPKPVIFSRVLSYLDITGIYVPFTFEANVNVDIPGFWIPSTMMHELAHSKGFMREDEANFISYLACMASGSQEFAYSGVMLALVHTSNALYDADQETYWPVIGQLGDGVGRDLAANDLYWSQFEGTMAEASAAMIDVYLKSNRQASGVASYGMMVDLLLAEYRQRDSA